MSSGAAVAAIAAAEQRRREEEEEEMTKYTDADLQEGWEFKILRSNAAAFRKPEEFQKACAEEATAGWTLVEKFDDQRLRFKRPISARGNDSAIAFDPYRTQYRIPTAANSALGVGCVLVASLLIVAAVIGIVSVFSPAPPNLLQQPAPVLHNPLPSTPTIPKNNDRVAPFVKEARHDTEAILNDLLAGKYDNHPSLAPVAGKVKGFQSWSIKTQTIDPHIPIAVIFGGTLKGPEGEATFTAEMVKQQNGKWMIGTFDGPNPK